MCVSVFQHQTIDHHIASMESVATENNYKKIIMIQLTRINMKPQQSLK